MNTRKTLFAHNGFTLIETTIVLALIGLLTLTVVIGSNSGIQNERFSGSVKQLAANIRDAQTKGYSLKTGTDCSGNTDPGPGGQPACFWRGNVIKFTASALPDQTYPLNLLYGSDLSVSSGFVDPKTGLYGTTSNIATYSLDGLTLTKITVGGGAPVAFVSLAFLAPDGHAYSCDPSHNASGCNPSRLANSQPYKDSGDIVLTLTDTATSHIATVTIKPSDGTISTIIQ